MVQKLTEEQQRSAHKIIHLPTIVGAGYSDFWHFQGRYCIVKGSRASKKSQTTALWVKEKLTNYYKNNLYSKQDSEIASQEKIKAWWSAGNGAAILRGPKKDWKIKPKGCAYWLPATRANLKL